MFNQSVSDIRKIQTQQSNVNHGYAGQNGINIQNNVKNYIQHQQPYAQSKKYVCLSPNKPTQTHIIPE
jgi:hypothetical protein